MFQAGQDVFTLLVFEATREATFPGIFRFKGHLFPHLGKRFPYIALMARLSHWKERRYFHLPLERKLFKTNGQSL